MPNQKRMREETAYIGGRILSYGQRGEGPSLVMIHGMGDIWGSRGRTDYSLDLLARDFGIFLPNMPGYHGSESLPPNLYGLKIYSGILADFCRELGIQKAHLLGHSFGTFIVSDLAQRYPDLFQKIILVGAPIFMGATPRRVIRLVNKAAPVLAKSKKSKELFMNTLAKTPFGKVWISGRDYREIDPHALRANLAILEDVDLLSLAKGITGPKLYIWGENDPLYSPEAARGIEHEEIVLIRNAAHSPMAERPKKYAKVVREFLLGEAS